VAPGTRSTPVSARPDLAAAALKAGAARYEESDADGAIAAWREAIAADAACVPAHLNIARVLEDRGALHEALAEYCRARELAPDTIQALAGIARICAGQGRFEEALAACERIIAGGDDDGWAAGTKAWILERQGKVLDAYELLLPLVRGGDAGVHVASVFAQVCERLDPPSAEAVAVLEAVLGRPGLADADRRQALWALARLLDALGRFDEAFARLEEAKRLEPDPASRKRVLHVRAVTAAAIAAYTPERLARLPRATHGSELPIFIVGMPRSGTTLAEQILASHPRVFGAGELAWLPRLATKVVPRDAPYPDCLDALTPERVERLARGHLAALQALAPRADRVVDKMMSNYQHLGLIQLLFPRARVIHCLRHPLDTCLSVYFHDIQSILENRDLAALGAVYRDYRRLMARWRELLDLGVFTLRYEALVAEPERTVRELLAFCGLEWDERCLRFHETSRVVRTYSYHQVRKPVYAASVARHAAYARHLGPLREVLREFLEDEDEDEDEDAEADRGEGARR
jgi:tetratricopeptide (TPR) repeat protein